jgi:adenylate cyclase
MRELFTRHVGQEVAEAALASEPQLGGAVCDVSVLFVDLVGSTRLAATQPPERVVARLNRFFAVVVEVVEAQGGWINKFEGDAALCVFGAPEPLEGHAGHALSAARELHRRLAAAGIDAGVGVSSGPAVAGWIGTERRFEYTVIGDAVNEAARLCDAAKRDPRKLLASGAIVARADPDETPRWALGELLHLRGRTEPTRVAAPA